jgi:hypothetical protein
MVHPGTFDDGFVAGLTLACIIINGALLLALWRK